MDRDAMWVHARLHAMYAIANAPLRSFPFPHIFVEPVFPSDFYAGLQQHLPASDCFTRLVDIGGVSTTYNPQRLVLPPAPQYLSKVREPGRAFWQSTFETVSDAEFRAAVINKFLPTIRARFSREGDPSPSMRTFSEVCLTRDFASFDLGPHTDSPAKLVSLIVYLPADDSRQDLGTSLYVPKDRKFVCDGGPHHPFPLFDRVATMPYRPNALFAFPKTVSSFHGVEPVEPGSGPRDLLQLNVTLRKPAVPPP
jgi:hypothetical protein